MGTLCPNMSILVAQLLQFTEPAVAYNPDATLSVATIKVTNCTSPSGISPAPNLIT